MIQSVVTLSTHKITYLVCCSRNEVHLTLQPSIPLFEAYLKRLINLAVVDNFEELFG